MLMIRMTAILAFSTSLLLLGCGGSDDSTSAPNNPPKDESQVPANIQGYYETTVIADNGDEILVNLMVKPDGEYIGLYNNSFSGGSYTYKKEVLSLIAGQLKTAPGNKLVTQVREFDSANSTMRNYKATAQYAPDARLTLDLTGTDATIDKKVYDLRYVALDSPKLAKLPGKYSGALGTLTEFTLVDTTIANTYAADTKKLTINIGQNCQFIGSIKDAGYELNYYPYTGTMMGKGCVTKGDFSGLVIKINGMLIVHGTNTTNSDVMRFNTVSFNNTQNAS
jgi:hypothetical protein